MGSPRLPIESTWRHVGDRRGLPLGVALGARVPPAGDANLIALADRAGDTLLPVRLEMNFRAAVEHEAVDFTGALEQITDDVAETRKLGAAEIVFDVQFSPGVETVDDIVARMEQLYQVSKQA